MYSVKWRQWSVQTDLIPQRDLDVLSQGNNQDVVQRRIASAAFVRWCLGDFLSVDGSQLDIQRTSFGQPVLKSSSHPCFFSLSHSEDQLVVVVSKKSHVGIDLQLKRNLPPKLQDRILSKPEKLKWARAGSISQESLLKLWTIKEATQKYFGLGFALPMDAIVCEGFGPDHFADEGGLALDPEALPSAHKGLQQGPFRFQTIPLSGDSSCSLVADYGALLDRNGIFISNPV